MGARCVVVMGGRRDREEPAHGPRNGRRHQRRDDQEVHRDGDADGDHRRAEQRAGDGSDAEAGVEPRHDRATETLLDERSLHVHRDVPGAVSRAEQEEPDDDRRDADLVADRRDRKAAGGDERRDHDRARGTEPRHDHPGERQRETEPAAIASSRKPRLAGRRCRPSRTCGMRDAQLEKMKPEPMKTAYTASVAWRRPTSADRSMLSAGGIHGRYAPRSLCPGGRARR